MPRNAKTRRRLSGVGDYRANSSMWSCEGVVMSDYDKNIRISQFPNTRCVPLSTPPPSDYTSAPAQSYAPQPIIVTQTQTPVQTQSSGQSSDIGSRRSEDYSSGVSPDMLSTILDYMTRSQSTAPVATPSSTSVSVTGGGEVAPTQNFSDFFAQNKKWFLWGGAAILLASGYVFFSNRKKYGRKF